MEFPNPQAHQPLEDGFRVFLLHNFSEEKGSHPSFHAPLLIFTDQNEGTYTFETSCITSLNPPSDVETLALDGSLQLTFSEAVQRGTGSIILLPLSFADEYRAIPIHDTTQARGWWWTWWPFEHATQAKGTGSD